MDLDTTTNFENSLKKITKTNSKNYNEVLKLVTKYFPDNPAEQVAIMGHIGRETDGTYDYTTSQRGRKDGAYGLFQYESGYFKDLEGKLTPNKKIHYRQYLQRNTMKDSAESQIKYFRDSLYGDATDGGEEIFRYNGGTASKRIQDAKLFNDPVYTYDTMQKDFFRSGKKNREKGIVYMKVNELPLAPAAGPNELYIPIATREELDKQYL